jgi:uncharacterized membrane protein YkvA (DUF1232 family)
VSGEPEEPRLELNLTTRERRWYDRIRSSLVTHEPGEGSGFKDLLLLLPDVAVLLGRLGRDSRVTTLDKAIALGALAYLISPIDLLPEFLLGPFGLADDLIVVGAALSRLVNRLHPDLLRYHWSGQEDVLDAIQRITGWTEGRVGRLIANSVLRLFGRRGA